MTDETRGKIVPPDTLAAPRLDEAAAGDPIVITAEPRHFTARVEDRHLDLLMRALVDEVDGYNDLDAMMSLIDDLAQQMKTTDGDEPGAPQAVDGAEQCLALRHKLRGLERCVLMDGHADGLEVETEDCHDWLRAEPALLAAFRFGEAVATRDLCLADIETTTTTTTGSIELTEETDDRQVALELAHELALKRPHVQDRSRAAAEIVKDARTFLEFLEAETLDELEADEETALLDQHPTYAEGDAPVAVTASEPVDWVAMGEAGLPGPEAYEVPTRKIRDYPQA